MHFSSGSGDVPCSLYEPTELAWCCLLVYFWEFHLLSRKQSFLVFLLFFPSSRFLTINFNLFYLRGSVNYVGKCYVWLDWVAFVRAAAWRFFCQLPTLEVSLSLKCSFQRFSSSECGRNKTVIKRNGNLVLSSTFNFLISFLIFPVWPRRVFESMIPIAMLQTHCLSGFSWRKGPRSCHLNLWSLPGRFEDESKCLKWKTNYKCKFLYNHFYSL